MSEMLTEQELDEIELRVRPIDGPMSDKRRLIASHRATSDLLIETERQLAELTETSNGRIYDRERELEARDTTIASLRRRERDLESELYECQRKLRSGR